LYGKVWVPRIVLDEYQAKAPPTEPDLAQASWLTVVDAVIIDPTLPLLDVGPSLHKGRNCFACPLLFRITE